MTPRPASDPGDGWRLGWPTTTDRGATVKTYVGPEGVRYSRSMNVWDLLVPVMAGVVIGAVGALVLGGAL